MQHGRISAYMVGPMRRRVPAPVLFSLLSVALHLAWGWYMPSAGSVDRAELPRIVEFELAAAPHAEPPALPVEAPPPEEPPAEPAKLATAERRPARAAPKPVQAEPVDAPTVEPTPSAIAVAEPEAAPPPTAAAPEQVAIAAPKLPLNLSARAAALTTLQAAPSTLPAAHCSVDRNAQTPSSCGANDAEQTAQAELSRNLRAMASKVPHLAAREKPKLQQRSDGTYEYDGHVFRALVRRDGLVDFADSGTNVELRPSLIPFKATGDISDLVEKLVLGKELYSAEKLWFLDQTRELRDKLATAYRLEEAARARRELEQQLQRILHDHNFNVAQKHSAVFALWQDCGDDAQARQTQQQVEAFVQRFMPVGSELGFAQAELEHFNAQRVGLRPFRPYPANVGGSSG